MFGKWSVVVFTVFALMFGAGRGQAGETREINRLKGGGGGGFMMGLNMFDFDDLDRELGERGYAALPDNTFELGGGGYGLVGRVLLGGEGFGFSQKASSTDQKVTIEGGYGFFDLGYVVLRTGNFFAYPCIGIGGGSLTMTIYQKGDEPTFDEILDDPAREVRVSTGGFMLNAALGMDYLVALGGDEMGGQGGILVGLRAGYMFTPSKGDWKMEETSVLGGPELGLDGPYVHLMLGFGGLD
ncbi:hypothetical protein KAU04_05585 [bacterium]|nr:hypothetical protein [bacterium]